MKASIARFPVALIAAAAFAVAALSAPAAAGCLSAGDSRKAIAAGEARPLNAILRQEGLKGDVVRVSLCENGSRLEYQVSVLLKDGKLVNRTLPAN